MRILDDNLANLLGTAHLPADETKHKMMLMLKKSGRINQIRAANRIQYLRDRDAGGEKACGIGHHLKFWNAATLDDYRGDAVQSVDPRFHIIRRDFP